jgi:hypothetical protein
MEKGYITPQKLITLILKKSKDTGMAEMPKKECKSLLLKLTNNLKEDSNKPLNEVNK